MKFKKWLPLLLAGLMATSVLAFAGCDSGEKETPPAGGTEEEGGGGQQTPPTTTEDKWHNEGLWLTADPLVPTKALKQPSKAQADRRSTDVSVHDFQDPNASSTYYAFGTHFAVASTRDFITWKQEVSDNDFSKLYGSGSVTYSGHQWPEELDETLKIVQPTYKKGPNGDETISTTWAPDVEYYNGKYYMYYSITKAFGSDESAIGRVESTNVLGPYSNNVVLFDSVGETGSHPNCIDPELFYDKDGKLWMVYGSHFAGVYIKELYNEGENWGLPKEEGWGKLLWKGGSEVVEGPFVFYNATTEYYYLMTSYGALMTDYNMRIARSKNPDGPYVDIEGTDLSESSGNGSQHGNVIAGNYKFSSSNGYAAMGHNSVIKDKSGRYFVIYHSRRQEGASDVTAAHKLFASQLYFNEEGWPVMSPNAYVGESAGTVTAEDIAGGYEIVIHSAATTKNFVNSQEYTLTADGKVMSGTTEAGSWTLSQNFYISVTIGSATYQGVAVPSWDMYTNKNAAVSITAVSDKGVSLWAIHKA